MNGEIVTKFKKEEHQKFEREIFFVIIHIVTPNGQGTGLWGN